MTESQTEIKEEKLKGKQKKVNGSFLAITPNDPRGAFLFTILKKLQSVGFSFFKFKILEKNRQHEWRKHGVIFSVGGRVGEWPLKGGHV